VGCGYYSGPETGPGAPPGPAPGCYVPACASGRGPDNNKSMWIKGQGWGFIVEFTGSSQMCSVLCTDMPLLARERG
jgi:hypothetical protein